MSLTPSKRFRNFTAVLMAATSITGVKKITNNNQSTILQEAGDADQGPTHTVLTFLNPVFSVVTNQAMVFNAVLAGVQGVFTYVMNDSKNLAAVGGGGYTFTTNSQSIVGDVTIDGDYNQLVNTSVTIQTNWLDGVTNPVSAAVI